MTTEMNKDDPIPMPSADDHPPVQMPRAQSTQSKDAVALLTAGHDKVKQLFREYGRVERLDDTSLKGDLAQQLAMEAEIHSILKRDIFYPAVKEALADKQLVEQSLQGQAEVTELVARLRSLPADDPELDGTVQLLRTSIEAHMRNEETGLFPQVRQGGLDLLALYEQVAERKEQLEHDLGGSPLRTGKREATGERDAVGQADS